MSLHQTQERRQEKQLSLRQRVALFQSSSSANEKSDRGSSGSGLRKGSTKTNSSSSSSLRVQTNTKNAKVSNASMAPPPLDITTSRTLLPENCQDQQLRPFMLPSHCDSLFSSLHGLKEEGLLLDCILQLPGSSHRVHQLVLATVSQKAEEWILSRQIQLKEVNLGEMGEPECHISPSGLKAVLNFAYCGELDATCTEDLEEMLIACRLLGVERLPQVYRGEAPPCGRAERQNSLQVIRELWERHVGCDVIIEVESGERFPAHRVILAAGGDYFRALLCGGLRECEQEVVRIQGVAAWVLWSLLDFIYTGQLKLGRQNVWDLTEAALQFQLQGALTLCLNFLQEHLDDTSCLDILCLAETYGLRQLGAVAEDYVLAHFQRITEGEKFKDLSCPLLERLLERDTLNAESEVVLFRAVMSWVVEDEAQRLRSLPTLLRRIRFPLMTPRDLEEVQGCRLLIRSPEGRAASEAVRKLLEGENTTSDCKPRTPNQVLVLVGGDCVNDNFERREPNHSLWFARRFLRGEGLIRTVEWKLLAQLPDPSRLRHCVCVLNNVLYVLGGRKYYGQLDILKSALRFDPAKCKWERLPDMVSPRDYFAAVCRGGKVFVMGGNHDDMNCLDSVEYYTPEDNTWRLAHPLDVPICGHAAAVLDGEIYVSGGCESHLHCLPCMWHYDPTQGCSRRSPMTSGGGRAGHVMLTTERRLVVAGGLQPAWRGFSDQLHCEAYEPLSNSWTALPLLPRPHLSPAATVLDGRLYIMGGSSADSARDTPWVHRYDPRGNSWEKLGMMPRPFADLTACTLQVALSLQG
ncbi:kelch-like protein 26 [Brachyhypopomus gauderio]|uniref:kelch-like protein 26 n=1 Tax=Brachyhypopomus gauderio TaxID=698409 RepID=UPI0040423862